MEYNIQLTLEFIDEVDEICDYISENLKEKIASARLRQKIMNRILLLEQSPRMFAKIEKNDKLERQYRRIPVDNYVILYTIDEENKIVYIAHIYYSRRNYIDNLL